MGSTVTNITDLVTWLECKSIGLHVRITRDKLPIFTTNYTDFVLCTHCAGLHP